MRSATVTGVASKLGVLLVLAMALAAGVSAAPAAAVQWNIEHATTEFNLGGEGEVTFETAQGPSALTKITCVRGVLRDRLTYVTNQQREAEKITLLNCKTAHGGTCTSPSASAGEIILNRMTVRLEYLSRVNHEVGLVWNYKEKGEVTTFTTFKCTVLGLTTSFTLRGTALAKITPVNVRTNKWTLSLKGSLGKPELTEYEGESGKKTATKLEEELNGSNKWEAVDMAGAPTITAGESMLLEG